MKAVENTNIDEFNRLTSTILVTLYDHFPHHSVIQANDFFENVDEKVFSCTDGTMTFLRDEGFIKFSDSAGEGQIFIGVQLTLRGLELLNRSPESLKDHQTIVGKLRNAIGLGTKEVVSEGIKLLMGEAVKGI